MTNTFELGDIVQLKSGSPNMTVVAITTEFAYCTWYDIKTFTWKHDISFPIVALCKPN